MAYNKITWVDGATALSADNMNRIEGNIDIVKEQSEADIADLDSRKVEKVTGKGLSTNDYTTAEKTKLAGIATGAEVNQNAFAIVKVGNTTIAADSKIDTLTLAAGTNISLTPDTTNDKVTIGSSIPNASASAAGLMSAADKAKLDGMPSFVAGSYRYSGESTTDISFIDSALIGKTHIIAGAQDAGNPPLRADVGSANGAVRVYLADPVTVMRVNYIAW